MLASNGMYQIQASEQLETDGTPARVIESALSDYQRDVQAANHEELGEARIFRNLLFEV